MFGSLQGPGLGDRVKGGGASRIYFGKPISIAFAWIGQVQDALNASRCGMPGPKAVSVAEALACPRNIRYSNEKDPLEVPQNQEALVWLTDSGSNRGDSGILLLSTLATHNGRQAVSQFPRIKYNAVATDGASGPKF